MNKKIILSVVSLVALSSSFGYSQVVGKSIATVNGEAIFLSEFDENWKNFVQQQKRLAPAQELTPSWEKEQRKLLLDQMIDEKLLLQEAKRRKVRVQKRRLEEGIKQVKNRFKILPPGRKPTQDDFDRALTKEEKVEFQSELDQQGITEKEFEERVEDQLRIIQLTEDEVRARVALPFKDIDPKNPQSKELTGSYEKESKTLFEKIKLKFDDKSFKPNPQEDIDQMVDLLRAKYGAAVRASHILVRSDRKDDFKKRSEALNKIKAVKKQIDGGSNFEELAQQKSEGPSAKKGGDLGYFTAGQMVPEFEKAAFALSVGGVSDVVETEFGYHLIYVTEKRAPKALRYDDIKVDLAGYIYQKKGQDRYDSYIKELRGRSDIKVTYDFDNPQDS